MRLDVATVLRATDATVFRLRGDVAEEDRLAPEDLNRLIVGVTIDSRDALPDSLFVAISGERVDGAIFIPDALGRGALGCITSSRPGPELLTALPASDAPTRYLFVVADPLEALQRLAAYWRSHQCAEVVGITGSIGKTTTKEILASLLATRWPVLKSEANLNTEIGLPLMLLRLRPEHSVAVLEMGMYVPGDIALLASIARPRIGVVTNVAPIHLERVGSIERIAHAKSELVSHLPGDGLAILNGDNPWTRAMAATSGITRSVLIGLSPDCHYRAVDVLAHGLDGISFTLLAEGERTPIRTRVPGTHTVHAFLASAAVGRELGMSWDEFRAAAETVKLEARQRILRTHDGMLIIDDSYNAAPMSVSAALELLRESPGTRIAVLGDMLELGPEEEASHRQVGERAALVADWLVARGERSAWIADEAERRGMPPERVRRVPDNEAAVEAVREILAHGAHGEATGNWSVLVKGSRGMRMEEVVNGLRGDA